MLDKLRCQFKQFDVAWKSGLVIFALFLVVIIISRMTITLDVDQDPVIRKKIMEMMNQAKNLTLQADQDAHPAVALTNISMAKGYLNSILMFASADQVFKTTSINVSDMALQLDQKESMARSKLMI
jgi:hypothetical protein